MKHFITLLTIFSFSQFGCINFINENCTEKTKVLKQEETQVIRLGYLDFKLIGGLTKMNKEKSQTQTHFLECNNWTFKESSILNILKNMRKVEGNEAYALCYQYPCWYEGIARNGDINYRITIYAGANIILSREGETLHFIMEKKSDLFLDICDCCE